MEIDLEFPGGLRVDARAGSHRIATDQGAVHGGENLAPTPFTLFLAALATCAGYYALSFCRNRDLPTAGLTARLQTQSGPAGALERITIRIGLPPGFPERYRTAIQRAAEQCTVHRFISAPAPISIEVDALGSEPPGKRRAAAEAPGELLSRE